MIFILEVWSWVAMTCSIGGNFFINRKNVFGFWVWFVGSLIWLCLAYLSKNWSQVIMFAVYTYFNIDGIIRWSKRE